MWIGLEIWVQFEPKEKRIYLVVIMRLLNGFFRGLRGPIKASEGLFTYGDTDTEITPSMIKTCSEAAVNKTIFRAARADLDRHLHRDQHSNAAVVAQTQVSSDTTTHSHMGRKAAIHAEELTNLRVNIRWFRRSRPRIGELFNEWSPRRRRSSASISSRRRQ